MRMIQFYFVLLCLTGLASCKTTSSSSDVKDVLAGDRSAEIERAVIKTLKEKHEKTEGSLWSASRGELGTDWVLASPEGYWGKTEDQLPKNFECKPGDAGCDDSFARKSCSTDQDCADTNTSCQILEASASSSRPARTMCLTSADNIIDRFYRTMISAEQHLEVASLSMPSEIFRPAFINALTILHEKPTPPTVRILLSGEEVLNFNPFQPAQKALEKIWNEMKNAGNLTGSSRMKMNMGYLSNKFSWNHSKLIIADKKRMIQGGHNMWGSPYLIARPVSDLSMEVTGPAVSASQDFVNALWRANKNQREDLVERIKLLGSSFGSLPNKNNEISPPAMPGSTQGNIPMIAVGRMGTFGPNPSDDANKTLIRSAKRSIDFIVQDLYGLISNLIIVEAKPWAFNEIAEALMRGVKLRVIQSDTAVGPNDYTLVKYQTAHSKLIDNAVEFANQKGFKAPNGLSNRAYFCTLVEYTPIRYMPGKTLWDDIEGDKAKGKGYGSHAKLMIVDDSAFYLGSHNYYEANLQEFGLIVADKGSTKELQDQYWQPIWSVSQAYAAKCN